MFGPVDILSKLIEHCLNLIMKTNKFALEFSLFERPRPSFFYPTRSTSKPTSIYCHSSEPFPMKLVVIHCGPRITKACDAWGLRASTSFFFHKSFSFFPVQSTFEFFWSPKVISGLFRPLAARISLAVSLKNSQRLAPCSDCPFVSS